MGAYGFEQRVCGMRHMAVETIASGRLRLVEGVLLYLICILALLVALGAGSRSIHGWFELIRWWAVVHGVAGQAGKFALGEAATHRHAGVFTASGKNRPVVPPAIAKEVGILL